MNDRGRLRKEVGQKLLGEIMKHIIFLFIFIMSTNSLAESLRCSTLSGYRIGAPETFSIIETNKKHGKLVGMTTLSGESIRKRPVNGTLSRTSFDSGVYLEFNSNMISRETGYEGEPTYSIQATKELVSLDNFDGYEGTLSIKGESAMVRCVPLADTNN